MISSWGNRRFLRFFSAFLAVLLPMAGFAQKRTLPAGVADLGVLPASTPVKASLFVKPTSARQSALDQFLSDVQNSSSTNYRRWLTPAQFTAQFGATADQLSAISSYAGQNGLTVESSAGLHVEISSTKAKFTQAFAGDLHKVSQSGQLYSAETADTTTPEDLSSIVETVFGVQTLPESTPFTLLADGVAVSASGRGSLEDLATTIEANAVRVLTIHSAATASSFSDGELDALRLLLKQAAAQGITVLVQADGTTTDVGLPAAFSEGLAAVVSPTSELGTLGDEIRPTWQTASGLPSDGLRHVPDVTVSSMDALAATFEQILSEMPASADGSAARLGNVAQTIYELAPLDGLFTQPDDTSTTVSGRWEPLTGLGTVNLSELAKLYPRGSYSTNTAVTLDNPGATHGQNITFTTTVKDTSGKGSGVAPTGTVTFTMSTGTTLGPVTLSNGTASITTNQLAANWSYTVTAAYSGDATYAASSASTGFSIAPEAATITATPSGSVKLGGTMSVLVNVASASGVGTPTGTATLAPQGTSDTNTYSATLSGSNGSTSATVTAPAMKAGSIVVLAGCVPTSSDFTCYTPVQSTVTVTQATPTVTLASSVSGSSTTFTLSTTGLGGSYPVPTGNIQVADNGTTLGSATLSSTGSATLTVATPSSSSHNYVATYGGDSNYLSTSSTAQASGSAVSTTTMTVSPNPPVSGSTTTLTATVGSGSSSVTTTPTGTVTFYQDGVALTSAAALSGGVATYTSTTLSSSTAHTYYAEYSGDSTYASSDSASVATAASTGTSTTTTMTVSPNPPVSGSVTTLKATIAYTASGSSTPSGTVTFYQDGTALTPAATVSAGAATYTSSTLSGTAAHTFYAVYSGDSTFATSTSAAVTTTASSASSTTTALTVSPNPPVSGSLTTLKATVAYTGSSTPSGTVTFYEDGAALTPAATLVVSGSTATATFTSTQLSGTTAHTFYAVYSGDTNYATSTSASVTTSAGSVASTTTIASSASTVTSGSAVTLTATVASGSSPSSVVPTGTVTFTSATQGVLGTATLSSGVASLSAALTTIGTQAITATYSGDSTYAASTSATAASVTVTSGTSQLTLTVSPQSVSYGSTVTLTTNITATPTSGTTGPAGTVTWTLTPNSGAAAITYSATLTTTGTTTATASTSFTAPAVGVYTVTATCTGTNFSCTGLSATAALQVTKVATVTSLSASPTTITVGVPETLTATVAFASSTTTATCTGTVSFYVNGSVVGSVSLASNVATYSLTLPSSKSNTVFAVYSGDSNCATSTSSVVTIAAATSSTTTALTANYSTALQGANVLFTVVVSSVATTTNTNPGQPSGTVNFYDTFGGIQTLLGSTTLTGSGVQSSIAAYQTTGLKAGVHTISAVFAGSTYYTTSTSPDLSITIQDYSVVFSPTSSTATKGQTVTALATVTPQYAFSGSVVLACTPPSGTYTTCSFSPSVLTGGSGISTMTITTTAAVSSVRSTSNLEFAGFAGVAAALAGFFLKRRRSLAPLLALAMACVLLGGASGCTTVRSDTYSGGGGGGSSSGGTPSGAQQFTITAAGTDGLTTNHHQYYFQVTVQ